MSLLRLWILALLLCLGSAHAAPIDDAVAAYQRGDRAAARAAFTRLSAQGVPAADYNLAVMHLRRELPGANDREAVRLLNRAAEAGFVTAMVGLAELHEFGRAGLPVDLPQSVQWYRRAAEAGSVEAQVAVGTAHYLGRGAARDAAQAARWFRLAAQGGDAPAAYLFASMAEHGEGMARDLAEARYWYGAAARGGEAGAAEKVRELDARLAQPAT
jgi:TPR repeat protein